MKVGFVGASGLMGHGMAKNILAKGHELSYTVHTREPEDLKAAGAVRVADNAELGRSCEVVVICVTAAPDVEFAVTGPEGLLTEPRPGLIIADATTSEPDVTHRLSELAAAKGVAFIDTPLTLGPAAAEAGTLNVIVGGDDATWERVAPVIESFAGKIIRTGPVGTAHTLKLINNFVFQGMCTSIAEAFAVAAKSGLDPRLVEQILLAGTMGNKLLVDLAATLDGNYSQMTFKLDNARKDVRYYSRMAGNLDMVTPIGDGVHEALLLAAAMGYGGEFVPSLVKALEKLHGISIRSQIPRDQS